MSDVLASLIVKIGADIKDYSDGMKQAVSVLSDVGRKFESIGANLTAALTVPLAGVAAAAIDTAGKFEQTQIAFTHFLGSVQASKAYLADLYNFAATTPFQIKDVTAGAQALLAMGFSAKEVIPDLRILGDQLSAVGRTENMQSLILAFGEMKAKGVASMKEIRQMVTDGVIPAVKYLAEGLGVSETQVFSMLQSKAIDSGTAIKLIMAGMAKETGGMMSEQMKSFIAQLSNLKDKITLTLVDIGNALLPLAKDVLAFGANAVDSLSNIAHGFAGLSAPMQGGIIAMAGLAAAAGPAFFILGSVARTFSSIAAVLPMVQTGLSYISAAFAAIASPIGLSVAAVAAVVAGLYIFRDATFSLIGSTYQLRDVWNAAWIVMKKVVLEVGTFFGGIVTMIRDTWKDLTGWMSSMWGGAFGVIGEVMKTTVIALLGWAKSVLGNLVPEWVTKALDEAKQKRLEATKALTDNTVATDKNAAAAKDLAAINELESGSLEKQVTALKAAKDALSLVTEANRMGLASNHDVRIATDAVTAAFKAANPQFTQWWTNADRTSFAMRQLGQIMSGLATTPLTPVLNQMAMYENLAKDAATSLNSALAITISLGDPLAEIVKAATKNTTALSDAYKALGITSSATLQQQAADTLAAYKVINETVGISEHDKLAAWVAMEKARQAASIAADKAISDSEKKALQKAEADLGEHTKKMKGTWTTALTSIKQAITNDLSNALSNVIFRVGSLGDSFKRLGQDIVSIILDGIVKMGIEALLDGLNKAGKSISTLNMATVKSDAAAAASGAFKAVVGIPIIGPILAPPAAAAAFAGVMAFESLASFDKGGFIPEDMIAQVHKGEFVLTADQVAGRKPLPPAARGNDGGTVNNYITINADRNPRETARNLMQHLKSLSPKFSPAS